MFEFLLLPPLQLFLTGLFVIVMTRLFMTNEYRLKVECHHYFKNGVDLNHTVDTIKVQSYTESDDEEDDEVHTKKLKEKDESEEESEDESEEESEEEEESDEDDPKKPEKDNEEEENDEDANNYHNILMNAFFHNSTDGNLKQSNPFNNDTLPGQPNAKDFQGIMNLLNMAMMGGPKGMREEDEEEENDEEDNDTLTNDVDLSSSNPNLLD